MQKSYHIYVGSTYRDLLSERNAVLDGMTELSSQFPTLTFFCPRSIQPLEACREEIRHSDLLIIMLGHMQGVMVPGQNISYGEAEYQEAVAQGKQILVYLREEKAERNPGRFERDPIRANQLKVFKDKLQSQHTPKYFSDIPGLVSLVNSDVTQLLQKQGLENEPNTPKSRFKAVSSMTRKTPLVNGPIVSEQVTESQTRTIPVLQKALSTPYKRNKSGSLFKSKTTALALFTLVVAGILLIKFHNLPFIRTSFSLALPKVSPSQMVHSNPQMEIPVPGPNLPAVAEPAGSANMDTTSAAPAAAPSLPSTTVMLVDDTDTLKLLIRHAMQGSPSEQFHVAQMYELGQGFEQNDSLAFRWYKKAADRGMAEAQYKVAVLYRSGKGTNRSSYQAARWFQAAADQGLPKAQVKLGKMYQNGKGVVQNETTAFKWFLKAADQNDPDAAKILADLKEN